MVCAVRVMALLLRSERLRAGRHIISMALCVMRIGLFLLEAVSMEEKRGTIEGNGLNYDFVSQQQKVGGNRV